MRSNIKCFMKKQKENITIFCSSYFQELLRAAIEIRCNVVGKALQCSRICLWKLKRDAMTYLMSGQKCQYNFRSTTKIFSMGLWHISAHSTWLRCVANLYWSWCQSKISRSFNQTNKICLCWYKYEWEMRAYEMNT